MYKKFYTTNLIAVILFSSSVLFGQVRDTLSMGPGYENDIYYSFENGEVSAVPRSNWDIAFYTARFSAGIIINNSLGDTSVALYTYPHGDTSDWASVDTNGLANWPKLYNSNSVWEDGAFNANATGHPDYGWGIYNQVDHHLYGDSIYVMYITKNGYKKLWIQEKQSVDNIYLFKYANLDGSDEREVVFDIKPFEGKRFAYYSITNNEPVDREPETELWDIRFTKYIEMVPTNEGGFSPYPVTGVLSNVDIGANQFYPVTDDFNNWLDQPFDSANDVIGWDWKSFDMGTFSWKVSDSNYYFVQNYKGDVYKLKFVYWAGQGSGDFAFDKWLTSLSSVEENSIMKEGFILYPNPARSFFTVKPSSTIRMESEIIIVDLSGRIIYQNIYTSKNLSNGIEFNQLNLNKGLYFINIRNEKQNFTEKLIIR